MILINVAHFDTKRHTFFTIFWALKIEYYIMLKCCLKFHSRISLYSQVLLHRTHTAQLWCTCVLMDLNLTLTTTRRGILSVLLTDVYGTRPGHLILHYHSAILPTVSLHFPFPMTALYRLLYSQNSHMISAVIPVPKYTRVAFN